MPGTSEGAKKAAATNLAKDPNYYSKIGVKGGKMSTPGGFGTKKRGKDGLTGRERARKVRQTSRENNETSA